MDIIELAVPRFEWQLAAAYIVFRAATNPADVECATESRGREPPSLFAIRPAGYQEKVAFDDDFHHMVSLVDPVTIPCLRGYPVDRDQESVRKRLSWHGTQTHGAAD